MKLLHKKVAQGVVDAILEGEFPVGGALPGERELAMRFTVNRATVREALELLSQAGWVTVRERRATVVNDFWIDGTLDLVPSMLSSETSFPVDLAINMLEVRTEISPHYVRLAVEKDSPQVIAFLAKARKLNDTPSAIAKFDWNLHKNLAVLSGNKFYPLLLNSFAKLYFRMRGQFFATDEFRTLARGYYQKLMRAAINEDSAEAGEVTRTTMNQRLHIFKRQVAAQAEQTHDHAAGTPSAAPGAAR
ncbi:hypothetical protein GMSM_34030 [Geomonas sp. Red276]